MPQKLKRALALTISLVFLSVMVVGFQNATLTTGASAPVRKILCSEGTGAPITISGQNEIDPDCQNFYGSFVIENSFTTLDCHGANLWGVPSGQHALVASMSGTDYQNALAAGTLPFDALKYGIDIHSDRGIHDIVVRNCGINGFRRALWVHHEKTGAEAFWDFVTAKGEPFLSKTSATHQEFSAAYQDYNAYKAAVPQKGTVLKQKYDRMQKAFVVIQDQLLETIRGFDWSTPAAFPLPDELRRQAPNRITFENLSVNLTAMSGIYIDHHVTRVNFDRLRVRRAGGAGMYLEFGSRDISVRDSRFSGNAREGIAIDSSARNRIEHSVFESNVSGGIFMYRNCWEHFSEPFLAVTEGRERGNYFPRTQGSDDNKIVSNSFAGNGLTQTGRNLGVWVASRQSKVANFDGQGCGLFRMSQDPATKQYYHEDQARDAEIVGNNFSSVYEGVIVEDDGSRVFGNIFSDQVALPVQLGTNIRTAFRGSPLLNSRIAYNVMAFRDPRKLPIESVVSIKPYDTLVPNAETYRLETRVCSTFGIVGHLWGNPCTDAYLQIMKDQGFYDLFPSPVIRRLTVE